MSYEILSNMAASISELKKHPMATIESSAGESLVILNRNKPVCYCVPPKLYEAMISIIDDIYLAQLVKERENEEPVEININDL